MIKNIYFRADRKKLSGAESHPKGMVMVQEGNFTRPLLSPGANQNSLLFTTRLKLVYEHPDDIDLHTGLLSETHLPGGITGPTLACIIGQQFRNIR